MTFTSCTLTKKCTLAVKRHYPVMRAMVRFWHGRKKIFAAFYDSAVIVPRHMIKSPLQKRIIRFLLLVINYLRATGSVAALADDRRCSLMSFAVTVLWTQCAVSKPQIDKLTLHRWALPVPDHSATAHLPGPLFVQVNVPNGTFSHFSLAGGSRRSFSTPR